MAMIRVPLSKGAEATVAPDGEYELVVRKFESTTSKAGNAMLVATLGFTQENYELIRHNFNAVLSTDTDNIVQMKMRELNRFLNLFEIAFETEEDGSASFDTDDVSGATAVCRVTVASIDTANGPRDVNRLRLPRVRGE